MSAINLRTNHLVTHTHTHTHTTWIQIWSCSIVNFVSIGGVDGCQCFKRKMMVQPLHFFTKTDASVDLPVLLLTPNTAIVSITTRTLL